MHTDFGQTLDPHTLRTQSKRPKAKRLFITLSRCDIPREEYVAKMQSIFGARLRRWVCARERHTGDHGPAGSHHLHVFLEFNEGVRIPFKKLRAGDAYPYVVRVKDPASCLGYLLKEDQNYVSNFDVVEEGMRHYPGSKKRLIETLMDQGWPRDRIITTFKDTVRSERNMEKILRMQGIVQDAERTCGIRAKKGLLEITREMIVSSLEDHELAEFDGFQGYQTIIDHINDITRYGYHQPQHSDKRVLLMVGHTGIGKTRLLSRIEDVVPTYRFPLENWHPKYQDGLYRLILWDEPRWSIRHLQSYLLMFDGQPVDWPVKGSHVVREDHQKIIILSNNRLDELKAQMRGLRRQESAAIDRRVDEVNLEDRDLEIVHKILRSAIGADGSPSTPLEGGGTSSLSVNEE